MERSGVILGGCRRLDGVLVQLECLVRGRFGSARGPRNVWLEASADLAVVSKVFLGRAARRAYWRRVPLSLQAAPPPGAPGESVERHHRGHTR